MTNCEKCFVNIYKNVFSGNNKFEIKFLKISQMMKYLIMFIVLFNMGGKKKQYQSSKKKSIIARFFELFFK